MNKDLARKSHQGYKWWLILHLVIIQGVGWYTLCSSRPLSFYHSMNKMSLYIHAVERNSNALSSVHALEHCEWHKILWKISKNTRFTDWQVPHHGWWLNMKLLVYFIKFTNVNDSITSICRWKNICIFKQVLSQDAPV